jgi:hypothetical protein
MSMVSATAMPRSTATSVLTLARRASQAARSPSACTSSTPTAFPGRRCIRWSCSPTAA